MSVYYVGTIPYSSELYHHGILGQKWGVRRYQNKDGSLTPAGKEHYGVGKGGLDADQYLKDRAIRQKKRTLDGFQQYVRGQMDPTQRNDVVGSNQVLLKSGTELNRTSLKQQETDKERLYAALASSKDDMDYYSEVWPDYLRSISNNSNADVYQNTYKVKTDIIAPSYEQRRDIVASMLKADKKLKTELGKSYALDQLRLSYEEDGGLGAKSLKDIEKVVLQYARQYVAETGKEVRMNDVSRRVRERYKNYVDEILNKEDFSDYSSYKRFVASIPTSPKLMTSYINELKKNGYGAVFDDNSNTDGAFIVFDPSMLEQTGSRKL